MHRLKLSCVGTRNQRCIEAVVLTYLWLKLRLDTTKRVLLRTSLPLVHGCSRGLVVLRDTYKPQRFDFHPLSRCVRGLLFASTRVRPDCGWLTGVSRAGTLLGLHALARLNWAGAVLLLRGLKPMLDTKTIVAFKCITLRLFIACIYRPRKHSPLDRLALVTVRACATSSSSLTTSPRLA